MKEKDYTLGVDVEVQNKMLIALGYDTPEKILAAYNKPWNVGMFTTPVEKVLAKKKKSDEKSA